MNEHDLIIDRYDPDQYDGDRRNLHRVVPVESGIEVKFYRTLTKKQMMEQAMVRQVKITLEKLAIVNLRVQRELLKQKIKFRALVLIETNLDNIQKLLDNSGE